MKNKREFLLRKYKMGTKKKNLPKYQYGFTGGGTPNSPNYDPGIGYIPAPYTDAYTTSNAVVSPDLGDGPAATGAAAGGDKSGMIATGIASGLNSVAGGLSSAAAGMRANTRSEIDPNSLYAYDPSKSGFQGHKNAASMTAGILGAAGGVASSIPGPGAIIGAGLNAGAAGTEMGLADLEKRLIRAHDAMYKQRMNVGGKDGNFTTQGQFTTREAQEDPGIPAAKKGGYLKQYMGGGMMVSDGVPMKYANAELEGGEIVEKPAGPDIYVKGPSHERGGVPMMLQEGGPAQGGDYVWSDHLTYKGKTMAELYAMAVQNGASEQEIDQIRMLQEQLAGRAGDPQDAKELQEMPEAKTGGMLKKYQVGTDSRIFPDGTEMPVLSDSEYNRIMKEKQMKDLEALQNSYEYNEGMANLSWAPGSAANVASGKYGKLPSKEEVEREGKMKRAADMQYYKEQGLNSEGQPYSEEDPKSANVGEVGSGNLLSKTGTQIYGKRSAGDKALELLPYGTAAVGMIAQLAATLGAKNPYKGIKTPSAALVSTPENQFLERMTPRAEEAQNARGASLSKELLRQAGFGQGETAAVQKIELDRQAADAQATQRAREFNMSQDRAEKQLNTEMKLRSEIANQAALNERSMQEYQRMLSERGFETERGMNAADIGAGSLSDIGKFASDRTFAKAIEGDSGVGQRAWNYDPIQARSEIMSENPQKDEESGSEYQSRINRLERENSKRYEEEYMRKVAERRRRYTQMRGTDGEQS
jgi:hypothetical protein